MKKIEEDNKVVNQPNRITKSKSKSRKGLNRVEMKLQDPKVRITNFEEVALGLTEEMVEIETLRCLQCENPLCVSGCPVNIKIPQFIKLLQEKNSLKLSIKLRQIICYPQFAGECVLKKFNVNKRAF